MPTLILTSTFALGANLVWLAYNIFILPVQVQAVTSEATKGIAVPRDTQRGKPKRAFP